MADFLKIFFGSKNNLMLKMVNLFAQICCPYIMETCNMIWNEFHEDKIFLRFHEGL